MPLDLRRVSRFRSGSSVVFVAFSCLVGPVVAAAQEVVGVAACARIAEAASRLACYDKEAGRPLDELPVPPAPGAPGPAPPLANPPATTTLPSLSVPPGGGLKAPDATSVDRPAQLAREALDERRSLGSNLADRWELEDNYDRGRFVLRPYKPMFVLLADWTSNPNQLPTSPNPLNVATTSQRLTSTEAKYQISFKTKAIKGMIAGNGDLWLGYTQQSFWQIYNAAESRPFRETNYEPEVMAVFRTNYSIFGWQGRIAALSLNHQSNGYDQPLSRSWNRIIAEFGFERKDWTLTLRPWWRIPESAESDDNPDIKDYNGRMEMLLVRQSAGHEWSLIARHSLRGGNRSHGSAQLGYAWPISSYLKGYVQVFSGYGSSLLDYNHRQTRIGLGISLVQWL